MVGEAWDATKEWLGLTEAASDATKDADPATAGLPGVLVYGAFWSAAAEAEQRAAALVAALEEEGWDVAAFRWESEKATSGLPRHFGWRAVIHRPEGDYSAADAEAAAERAVKRIDDLLAAFAGGASELVDKVSWRTAPIAIAVALGALAYLAPRRR